jgi:hypothetical protein
MSALCQKRTLTSYSITSSVSAHAGTVFGANEAQMADNFIAAAEVRRMVHAVAIRSPCPREEEFRSVIRRQLL